MSCNFDTKISMATDFFFVINTGMIKKKGLMTAVFFIIKFIT